MLSCPEEASTALPEIARGGAKGERPVANDRPFELVCLSHDARQLVKLSGFAGEFQHIDPADAVPLLQSPANAAVTGEGLVTEILPYEESPVAMLAFGHLKFDSGAVGMIALETPELPLC